MKTVILAISAAAVVILSLDKIGVTPIAPGYNTRFQRVPSNLPLLIFRTDAGDLDCWIRLRLKIGGSGAATFSARLRTGAPLAAASRRVTDSVWVVEISKPSSDSAHRTKFQWQSGIELTVTPAAGSPAIASVEDWQVFLRADQSDSMWRAKWRNGWFRISLGLIFIAIVAAIITAWPPAKPRASAMDICLGIVRSIEGPTTQDTKLMRSMLEKVLDGTPVRSAMEALRLDSQSRRAKTLWFAARGNFLHKLNELMGQLTRYRSLSS